MLRLYRHRINTLQDLEATPEELGIEFDLRSDGDRVIVTHDPFTTGPTIEEFFPRIGKRPCIFNVKCEGVEARVLELAAKHGIADFFFLDCSVPAAVKLARMGEKRIAVRYSEMEPVEGVLAWADKATWVWVDCFTEYPADPDAWARIAQAFKICLVSPELQGHGADKIPAFRESLGDRRFDAACSKRPELWAGPGT
ncbi:hypothetical protein [Pendulispora albinea]|uniref:GP-PDE domain-containing protein n=1 Tax=Pendulispora albinea TaxID=2741071 RepID=A0ABZ2LNK4_9BACT